MRSNWPWTSHLSKSMVTEPIRGHSWQHTEPLPPCQLHPAVPCQEARGGCRTRWQWSWPQNNWLSARHPIIPCSHYVIFVFRCINAMLSTKQNRCLHLLFVNVEMDWNKTGRNNCCRQQHWWRIYFKRPGLKSQMLYLEDRRLGRGWEDVYLNWTFFFCCVGKSLDLIKEHNVRPDVIVVNFLS